MRVHRYEALTTTQRRARDSANAQVGDDFAPDYEAPSLEFMSARTAEVVRSWRGKSLLHFANDDGRCFQLTIDSRLGNRAEQIKIALAAAEIDRASVRNFLQDIKEAEGAA